MNREGQSLADDEALELRDEDLPVVRVVETIDADRELRDLAVEDELLGGAMVHDGPFEASSNPSGSPDIRGLFHLSPIIRLVCC